MANAIRTPQGGLIPGVDWYKFRLSILYMRQMLRKKKHDIIKIHSIKQKRLSLSWTWMTANRIVRFSNINRIISVNIGRLNFLFRLCNARIRLKRRISMVMHAHDIRFEWA